MSVEWSLKDKIYPKYLQGKATNNKYPDDYFYKYKDIENLRQKLIEDINEISVLWRGTGKIENQRMKSIFKRIINKRFGVEK
jgi:hypothetical protein